MPIDNKTLNLQLPLPNKDNTLEDDVVRIEQALKQVDSAIYALQQAQSTMRQELNELKESARKVKINSLVGENILIP